MSTAPEPLPHSLNGMGGTPTPAAALIFDDPLSRPSADDTDRGWGDERPSAAADLARFLNEKPPHHI